MQHGSGNRNTARARRAREAAEWDSARGAEREAQHAALMVERLDAYWALLCERGRQPWWQLRKGSCLEADGMATIAADEQLLLYVSRLSDVRG
jgi:hypothetical protein